MWGNDLGEFVCVCVSGCPTGFWEGGVVANDWGGWILGRLGEL